MKSAIEIPRVSPRRGRAGYTLIEAMIATMILGIVLLSVITTCGRCMRYLQDIRHIARSSQVLQQQMEAVRLYTNWPSLWGLNNTTFTNTSIDISGANTSTWVGTITTSSYSPYLTSQVLEVTLTVTWTNQTYKCLTNSLTTLVSNGGLDKYIF